MKSGANNEKPSRRRFLKLALHLFWVLPVLDACKRAGQMIVARIMGAPYTLGHRLLTLDFPAVSVEKHVKTLVVGSGITGLSACRQLVKNGETDFLLIEMDEQSGGNSAASQNQYTQFPLGAHYLPLPNLHDTALLQFLAEEGIITHTDAAGKPVFDETQLAASPQERLFINDHWQDGLVPAYGLSAHEQDETQRFLKQMAHFKTLKGSDVRYVFDIPIKHSTRDLDFRYLDQMTMAEWLTTQDYKTEPLLQYIDYCCRDDFGLGIDLVSAWAGIHYFAARKNPDDNVLTWPAGNAYLVQRLERYAQQRILHQHLAYHLAPQSDSVIVQVYDARNNISIQYRAEKVIVATPQFVTQRLLPTRPIPLQDFQYAPWLTATLVLRAVPPTSGAPLSWDNVIHRGQGLGYIHTMHQHLAQKHPKCILTYYCAFSGSDSRQQRQLLHQHTEDHWKQYILDDLRQAHPDIDTLTESIDIQLWGHGMISPRPGFIFGSSIQKARQPVGHRIYFAHTDLCGMSLFEEAYHSGIDAANWV